ncbi:MAG: MbnP family protein [Ferruginibacter sp.]
MPLKKTIVIFFFFFTAFQQNVLAQNKGSLKIIFTNTVNGFPLVLSDSVFYTNPFSETYSIHKFKYYISNIYLNNAEKENESYHLIDAAKPESLSFEFRVKAGNYNSFNFLLGIDSLRNCSGAQSGALDPMNDMFWTWNSGYVTLKLEGTSPISKQFNNRIEYHLGGYAGINKVMQPINLSTPFKIMEGKTTIIFIQADINMLWQNPNDIKIASVNVCTTPGTLAKKIADNCSHLFSIKNILLP